MRKSSSDVVYLDANFFVFALLDKTKLGEDARKIYQNVTDKKLKAATSSLTLDEIMWVLIKNKRKHLLKDAISDIYRTQNLTILPVSVSAPMNAVNEIFEYDLNPRDAFHVAVMREHNITTIISDDSDFKKVSGITCYNFEEFLSL